MIASNFEFDEAGSLLHQPHSEQICYIQGKVNFCSERCIRAHAFKVIPLASTKPALLLNRINKISYMVNRCRLCHIYVSVLLSCCPLNSLAVLSRYLMSSTPFLQN